MSAEAHAHHDDEHTHRSTFFYTAIAVFLGAITFVELGPLFEWYDLPALVLIAMSVVKFLVVIAFFMHLWDDDSIYTRVFAAPLVGGVLMVMVLMTLFSSWYPSAADDSTALQERHWNGFSGECYSWLTSARSNKAYCASGCSEYDVTRGVCRPDIDRDRVIAHLGGVGGGGPSFSLAGLSEAEVKKTLIEEGEALYEVQCSSCHGADGKGQAGVYPPLAGSDYEGFKDGNQHAGIIINGLNGEIVVNGATYNGAMSAFGQLHNLEIAAIATYERHAWGNDEGVVTPDMVKAAR